MCSGAQLIPDPTYAAAPVAAGMNTGGNVTIGGGLQIGD